MMQSVADERLCPQRAPHDKFGHLGVLVRGFLAALVCRPEWLRPRFLSEKCTGLRSEDYHAYLCWQQGMPVQTPP